MPFDPYFSSADHRFRPTEEMKRNWAAFLAKPHAEQKAVVDALRAKLGAGEELTPLERHLWNTNCFRRKARAVGRVQYTYERKREKALKELEEGKRVRRPVFYGGFDTTGSNTTRQKRSFGKW